MSPGGIVLADVEDPSIGSPINPRKGLSTLGSKSSGTSSHRDWGIGELGASGKVHFFGPSSSSVGWAILFQINLYTSECSPARMEHPSQPRESMTDLWGGSNPSPSPSSRKKTNRSKNYVQTTH